VADRVITISEFSRQSIIKHHHLPMNKVKVAYLSADERFYCSDKIAQQPDHALPSDYIFYPANFWKHKNHDQLLQALRILHNEKGLDIHVVLTGYEQPNGYPLKSKIESYGLNPWIHVLGYVSVEELAYLYRHARMLVFPSLFEGFGIPLVEAMAVGCAIVASNTTSVPEITGDVAELFDPTSPYDIANAIAKVWQYENLRNEMIKRGKRCAQVFSVMKTAQAHRDVFKEALRAYSFTRYLWNDKIYMHYYNLYLKWHWRGSNFKEINYLH
jgi:glycosyltransferase involved in cell wall biosynthesis